jgi:protein SCO1/2
MLSRRQFLGAAAAFPVFADHGRIVPPAPIPDVKLLLQDGSRTSLASIAAGHATAVQLIFTGCSTTCPIQAAIFQMVEDHLPDMAAKGIQLLSLSVVPLQDTPTAMRAWLRRFNAGPNWLAASPDLDDVPRLQGFFGKASGSTADHSTQVSILDRQGRLAWRTIELPTAREIAGVLRKIAALERRE